VAKRHPPAIRAIASELAMDSARYRNPVHADYLADPFVWRCGRESFAMGTGPAEAAGEVRSSERPTIFPLLRSRDLAHWERAGRALVRPSPELGDTFWAPEVACSDGRWFLYCSVGHADRWHQLRVATSDEPLGPYRDQAALTDLAVCAFAIAYHAWDAERSARRMCLDELRFTSEGPLVLGPSTSEREIAARGVSERAAPA
ncbi:MAG TPA: family 43 glycosylhydrolase, partial [Myxococcota bacterium]|nr:family 43 glycosylhydrolase [Myxococcota bacterium]